jgi:hypothetical protein
VAVYVDDARLPFGRMRMAHMIADSEGELHRMAEAIGCRRAWYQGPPHFPHYDVPLFRRGRALELGAIALDRRQLARKIRELKARPTRSANP